jgi:hypothetical protein
MSVEQNLHALGQHAIVQEIAGHVEKTHGISREQATHFAREQAGNYNVDIDPSTGAAVVRPQAGGDLVNDINARLATSPIRLLSSQRGDGRDHIRTMQANEGAVRAGRAERGIGL